MLKQLYISNFTLIDKLDINFFPGFSVITGETGAGKSIILGAIGLLLGQRADTKLIKAGAEKCVIEAHFDLSHYNLKDFFEQNDIEYDADDCIVRRELTANGKSRAFINDTPAPLALLKELGDKLIDIHSQHQNLLIGKQDFQLEVVDIIANDTEQRKTYELSYNRLRSAEQRLKELKESIEQSKANADFMQFQYDELDNAKLVDGEQEEMERKADTMNHSEEIKGALFEADNALSAEASGIVQSLKSATNAVRGINTMVPAAEELASRMESAYIELKDISEEIATMLEKVDFDPKELDDINNRLDTIYSLQKKYHVETVGELISQRDTLKKKLSEIENCDEEIETLQKEVDNATAECTRQAAKLSEMRRKAARTIEGEMQQRLVTLGMPNVRFEVSVEAAPLSRTGADKVSFLFSANRSTPPQSVAQVASGGEIARVMLSLKAMISGAVKLPTIIFDEIDTGVSGKIAEKMAQIMRQMGEGGRQVISITHLPQIASLGNVHYKVYKEETADGTTSRMTQLTDDERVHEIAQMLSGSDVSEAAMKNAKELLRL